MTAPFTRLSTALADRYRIERELGQGGMATVYLAQDLRHDRQVALKVLKPELAAVLGAERFVVEIKTTAQLQHPHILPLFDSGSADGFLYYVMPYVQGETLRAKLDRETQLGIDEAVRITREVADALDYAHRHGVIHRDIKPENILLHDGRPMVADFGIALALSAAAGGRMTETGLSLGTPHYMSPEQATAEKELTPRSDIYSLGCVLYEMLTGNPPHTGATAQQIVMKILTEDAAPVTKLRRSVPSNVAAALSKAVERLPADRFESARTFSEALVNPSFTVSDSAASRTSVAERDWRRQVAVPALAAAVLLLAALVWALTRPSKTTGGPVTRYRVELPAGRGLSGSNWSRLAVSPDGSKLVYMGDTNRNTQLFLRSRDQLDVLALPGTDGAVNPTFSPDGERVAFMDRVPGGAIRAVSLAGGPAILITDSLVGAPGLAWGVDGFIYYDRIGVGPLMRAPAAGGGKAESIGQLDSTRRELQHSWPDALPNGKGIIMTVSHSGPGAMGGAADEIAVLDLATGKHRLLLQGTVARYARSGHLVYVTAEGEVMAVPFDQDRMELSGAPVALGEHAEIRLGSGGVDLALSATGTLWYVAGGASVLGTMEAVRVGRDGAATPIPGLTGLLNDPVLSPDGKRLAISIRELVSHIFVKELDQGPLSRLTVGGTENVRPAWLPDGRSLAFLSFRGTNRDIYQQPADGSRPATLLLDRPKLLSEVTFSRDGAWMLYREGGASAENDIYARRMGTDSSVALLATNADESSPALSPDGHWLAYVSNESGSVEVYVRPFPNTGDGRWQISAAGGQEPAWAHSGRELFYHATAGGNSGGVITTTADSLMVMQVTTGRAFVPGPRQALFPLARTSGNASHAQYAVESDDRHFIMIRTTEANRAAALVVVENLFEVLRSRTVRR